MKNTLLSILLLINTLTFAQGEASKWYFGNYAGLDFSTGTATPLINMPTSSNNLNSEEGCTSISNSAGELLFYTNGKIVWDKNHNIMSNGTNLGGDQSSTQSAIIVPAPETPNIYYIFTVDEHNDNRQGLSYSVVNMQLNNGLGAVTNKNINLLAKCAEKITAVKSNNCNEFWVIAYGNQNANTTNNLNSFFAFKVSIDGVNHNYVRSTFNDIQGLRDGRGYLKVTADGSKIAIAHQGLAEQGLKLYDFDNTTGQVYNQQQLYPQDDNTGQFYLAQPYGIEFSLSGKYLYVTFTMNNTDTDALLLQYDLQDNNYGRLVSRDITFRGALQMAPDGKIYRSLSESYNFGSKYVGVIQNPEAIGTNANYLHNAINLDPNNQNRRSRQGLPPFIQSMFLGVVNIINPNSVTIETSLKLCQGQSHTLTAPQYTLATYTWYKDGISIPEANTRNLFIDQPGLYKVEINTPEFSCPIKGEARVDIPNNPIINQQPTNKIICGVSSLQNLGINFQEQTQAILGSQSTDEFEVKYYYSLTDAQTNTNAITFPINSLNSYGSQQIFARIHAILNNNCNVISNPFNLIVANGGATIETLPQLKFCATSGNSVELSAEQIINQLFDGLDITNYTITLHSTNTNAENNFNNLNLITYTGQTLYVRIKDINTPICTRILPVTFVVNPLPEILIPNFHQCVASSNSTYNLQLLKNDLEITNSNINIQFYHSSLDAQNQEDSIEIVNLNQTNTTVYYNVIHNITGCVYSNQFTITQNLNIQNQNISTCVNPNISNFTYNISDFNLTNGTFYTTIEDAYNQTNPYTNSTITATNSTTLFYKEVSNYSCINLIQIQFNILEKPSIDLNQQVSICSNSDGYIQISSGIDPNQEALHTYLWNTGQTTPTIQINQEGEYTVQVTNALGCSSTATIDVRNYQIPTINRIEISDLSDNNTVQVLMSNYTNLIFSLDQINFQISPIFTNVSPGIYTLTIADDKGCNTYTTEISVLGIPNFFTPNADGVNDFWNMHGVSINHYPNTEIQIFDRYGKLIKIFKPATDHWDGTYNNKPLPSTDYWYILKLDNGKTYKSNFSLKR